MTPEQIEQHRKRFEKLTGFGPLALGRIRTSGMYATKGVEPMWRGYLMFADNMEVEIPTPHKKITGDYEWAYNQALEHVESMLERQGIKVKPCK